MICFRWRVTGNALYVSGEQLYCIFYKSIYTRTATFMFLIYSFLLCSARSLRSSAGRKYSVIMCSERNWGQIFPATVARVWNNLPASLWDQEISCTEFKTQLKILMLQLDCGTLRLLIIYSLQMRLLTYLLTYFSHSFVTVLCSPSYVD